MKNKRLLAGGIFIFGIILIAMLVKISDMMSEDEQTRIHQHIQDEEAALLDTGSLDITAEGFESHLPVVVLNTDGQQIQSKLDTEGNPEINIQVQIIDNENDVNAIGDAPAVDTVSTIRYRGNSSLYYDKKQYALEFINEDGTDYETEVMGMSAGSEWVLNGTFLDKSHIRNYIAYNIAGEIMDYSPNIRFCEVFIYDGSEYTYQGLYTMIESVKQAASRVDITKYDEEKVETSYIIRRDRFSEDEVMLYNYGTDNGLTSEWLGVKYPPASKLTEESYQYIEDDISNIEKILYSDDYETFMTYPNYIDVDSFVDYFVINEFFGNYDAGLHSTYAYKDLTGKLKMGPVWDYDGAMDNATPWELNVDATAFQTASWFDALIKDEEFCRQVVKRYKELRESYFSDEYIDSYIDEIVDYLGSAIDRDYLVWGYVFDMDTLVNEENEFGVVNNRNVETYEEEIDRIKMALHEHAEYLDSNFYRNIAGNTMSEPESLDSMKYMAILFIISFFVIVIIVRQE